jgi:broad specificity phosphatase PhoE
MINYLEKFIKENLQFEKVAVSTHGGSLMRIVHYCEQAPQENLHIPNCAMFRIEYHHDESKWVFVGRVD